MFAHQSIQRCFLSFFPAEPLPGCLVSELVDRSQTDAEYEGQAAVSAILLLLLIIILSQQPRRAHQEVIVAWAVTVDRVLCSAKRVRSASRFLSYRRYS